MHNLCDNATNQLMRLSIVVFENTKHYDLQFYQMCAG